MCSEPSSLTMVYLRAPSASRTDNEGFEGRLAKAAFQLVRGNRKGSTAGPDYFTELYHVLSLYGNSRD